MDVFKEESQVRNIENVLIQSAMSKDADQTGKDPGKVVSSSLLSFSQRQ